MKDTDFFLKLNVPNFSEMQKEVLDYLKKHPDLIIENGGEQHIHVTLDQFPIISSVFSPRTKTKINEISIGVVPPKHSTPIHIDGLREEPGYAIRNQVEKIVRDRSDRSYDDINWEELPFSNQYVLIIPISNYEKSMNYWYNVTNTKDKEIFHYYEREQFPYKWWLNFYTDPETAIPIEKVLIDKPTFIKSDIYHNIKNNGTSNRLALIIRIFEYKKYSSLDQVFDYTGLV
jgi:hypothetical protein